MTNSPVDLEQIVKSFQKWYVNEIQSKVEDYYSNLITRERLSSLSQEDFLAFFLEFAKEGGKIQSGGFRTADRFIENVKNNFLEFKQNILEPFNPDFNVNSWLTWSESFNFFGKGLATIYLNRVDKTKYVIVNNKSIEAYRLLGYDVANNPLGKTYADLLHAQTNFISRYPEIPNFFVADALSEFLIGSKEGRVLAEKLKTQTSKILKLNRGNIEDAIKIITNNPELRKGRASVDYDLIYNGNRFPPILVLSEANKIAGGQELLLTDFNNSTKAEFSILQSLGYVVERKKFDFSQELLKFLSQSETTDLTTAAYTKNYRGLNVKFSFGQGNQARVSWIAFLGGGNTVQNGIYPVFLYFKRKKVLVLAYGVSETNTPSTYWNNASLKSIKDYFEEKNLGHPERYGNSFVFKVYDVTPDLNPDSISRDLDSIIELYQHQIMNGQPPVPRINLPFNYQKFVTSASNANLLLGKNLAIRFVASLLTKPFVILTGLSGSGKTKLAQTFALWMCENEQQYRLVPVGADWTNREPLLGYPNALNPGEYIKPDSGVLELIMHANSHSHLPHFLILDEMNLSHVERYFADFLSVMESKEEIPLFAEGTVDNGVPAKLKVPSNLFVIGTVNIDETTKMFSPKVLDRANTIEFRVTQDEMKNFLDSIRDISMQALNRNGADMATSFLEMASNKMFASNDIEVINDKLVQFFGELKKTGAEFGYRSASEILRLIHQLSVLDDSLSTNEKLDIAIMQKLLPKLHGSRRKLCPVLETLGLFCFSEKPNIIKDVFENDGFDFLDPTVLYPLSLEKISRMYKGAIDNGFTSFAEA